MHQLFLFGLTLSHMTEYDLQIPNHFQPPVDLLQRIYGQEILSEKILMRENTADGNIRAKNSAFNKRVFIRFTIDQWKTLTVLKAYDAMHYSENNLNLI